MGRRSTGVPEGGRNMSSVQSGSGQYQKAEVCGQRKGTHNLEIHPITVSSGDSGYSHRGQLWQTQHMPVRSPFQERTCPYSSKKCG